jgi:siroheme decarboxylase
LSAPYIDDRDHSLLWQLESGLPLVPRPYEELGKGIGMPESEVISRIRNLITNGTIRRFGVVVRHHEVGFGANAMVVWDVSDDRLTDVVKCLTSDEQVTLCYQRPRHLPDWPFNLFSMIHGRDEETVRAHISVLRADSPLCLLNHDILFSRRRFKQTGARYCPEPGPVETQEVA